MGHAMDETSEPFDEFGHPEQSDRQNRRGPLANGLRAMSFTALWIAILSVIVVIIRHALPVFMASPPSIPLKSAIPLIAVGFSYLCLIVTLPRTPGQRLVGFSVALAFILWGVEQYLHDSALVAFIDDVVVFFFVVDLTIVIRHNLRGSAGEIRPDQGKAERKEATPGV
jgi:hypothetical protein